MSLATQDSVRELQRKLARKSKSELGYRFYSLYDKVYRTDVLFEAWGKVARNRGAAGVDGHTVETVKAYGEEKYLTGIQRELKEKSYRPQPLRRVWIPKADGKERPLGIPTLKDRIVQQAVRLIIEPVFEVQFSDVSFGFRPERNCQQAIEEVAKYLNYGCVNVVEADIVDCFGSIPHARLLRAVARRVVDKNILRLVKQWLRCGVMENGRFTDTTMGTPQGGVISPLLANIYLDALDQLWGKRRMASREGFNAHLVRYADDLVILTSKSPEEPYRLLKEIMGRLGLALHPEKTRVLNARESDFDFLGFNIRQRKNPKTGKWFPLRQPSQKAQRNLREKIRNATAPGVMDELDVVVKERLNPVLRGWVNYFRTGNSRKVFNKVRHFALKRVRRFIRRRQGRHGYGWNAITSEFLYGTLGLFYDYQLVRKTGLATA